MNLVKSIWDFRRLWIHFQDTCKNSKTQKPGSNILIQTTHMNWNVYFLETIEGFQGFLFQLITCVYPLFNFYWKLPYRRPILPQISNNSFRYRGANIFETHDTHDFQTTWFRKSPKMANVYHCSIKTASYLLQVGQHNFRRFSEIPS